MPDVRSEQSTGFGRRLRALREAAGLSQAALAAQAGVSRNTVGNLEGDWNEPTWPLVLRLASVLGVSTEAFRSLSSSSTREDAG
jgi:DNA-binding XRE family transcriptional regulator